MYKQQNTNAITKVSKLIMEASLTIGKKKTSNIKNRVK